MPFKPGKSGNPAGRKKENLSRSVAAAHGPKAIAIIADTMNNEEAEIKYRLDAAKYLADRAYGRPAQDVNIGGQEDNPVRVLFNTKAFE